MWTGIVSQTRKLMKNGFFHLFLSNFLIQFMVFGSQMLVAGLLLPEDFGRIKILQTFIDVASIIGGGGLIVAVLKMVPENSNVLNQKFVLRYSLKYAFAFSLLMFLFLNGLALAGLLSSDVQVNALFHLFSIVILISPISLIMVRYYQALDQFKKVSTIQLISKGISVFFIIGFTYIYLIKGYLFGVVLGFVITVIYLAYDLRTHIFFKESFTRELRAKLSNQIKNLSKYNLFGQISDQLRVYASFFVANYLILDRELFGQYSFALILIQGLGVLSSSTQQFLIPRFSRNSKNKTFFFAELKLFEKNYFYVALVIFVAAQIILPFLTTLVFSGKYDASIPYFRVLLIGWLIYSAFTLKGAAFIGLGRLDISFRISFMVLIIIVPVSILFCYFFGIWGVISSYIVQRFLNFVISRFYLNKLKKQLVK